MCYFVASLIITTSVFCFCSCSVAFRTTPLDHTGVPHILEHTVLCGSDKFPVRDPFFKMLNRSQSTFMNAFTCKCVILFLIVYIPEWTVAKLILNFLLRKHYLYLTLPERLKILSRFC